MKTFTIENQTNNITTYPTAQEEESIAGTAEALAELATNWPSARLVEIWNTLPGATPVKKFKDRPTAVSRIWRTIQSLGERPGTAVPETSEPALVTPVMPQTPDVAPQEAPARTKANRTAKPPQPATKNGTGESSKTEAILILMRQPDGATLKAIMDATNWQAHSARGFISGTLGKKMGLSVLSNQDENGERRYSIPS